MSEPSHAWFLSQASRPTAQGCLVVMVLLSLVAGVGPTSAQDYDQLHDLYLEGATPRDVAPPIPVLPGVTLGDAPLGAIGKIVQTDDPRAPAVCAGVLTDRRGLILTANLCIRFMDRPLYFVPWSTPENPAPFGLAEIDWTFDSPTGGISDTLDFAVATLAKGIEASVMFPVLALDKEPPDSWFRSPEFAVLGYLEAEPKGPPYLRTHCRIDSRTTPGHEEQISFSCSHGFLPGSVIVSRFDRKSYVVGIKGSGVPFLVKAFLMHKAAEKADPENEVRKLGREIGNPASLLLHLLPLFQVTYSTFERDCQSPILRAYCAPKGQAVFPDPEANVFRVARSVGPPDLPDPVYSTPVPIDLPGGSALAYVNSEKNSEILILK